MKDMLRANEVAEMLGVSARTLRNWSKSGKLDPASVTKGGHRRWNEFDVLKLLNATGKKRHSKPVSHTWALMAISRCVLAVAEISKQDSIEISGMIVKHYFGLIRSGLPWREFYKAHYERFLGKYSREKVLNKFRGEDHFQS